MSADNLLARLDHVKATGIRRWLARCPAHEDRSPSLSMRELDDGRVLLHCFGGCGVQEVLANVGMTLEALFPERIAAHGGKGERRPFYPSDVFAVARFEILIAQLIAADLQKQRGVSDADYARLTVAAQRLHDIGAMAYGR